MCQLGISGDGFSADWDIENEFDPQGSWELGKTIISHMEMSLLHPIEWVIRDI